MSEIECDICLIKFDFINQPLVYKTIWCLNGKPLGVKHFRKICHKCFIFLLKQ